MKLKISNLLAFVFLLITAAANCQDIENIRTVEIRAGRSLIPGDYFSIRHERFLSPYVNLSANLSAEFSNYKGLKYSCYGLDLLADVYTNYGRWTNRVFELKGAIGLTGMIENESVIYKDWPSSKRINYGGVLELTGEWAFTEDFSLTVTGQQKFLLVKELGNLRSAILVGLKFKILN